MLMALVSLEDPGLTVFPTHRLLYGLASDQQRGYPRRSDARASTSSEVARGRARPRPRGARGQLRLHGLPPHEALPAAAEGRWRRAARRGARAASSEAYRRLDAAVLEELVLKRRRRHQRRRHRRQARPRLRAEHRGRRMAWLTSESLRRGLLPAPDPGRAGARGRGRGRDDAAEVDLLLPEAADRASSSTR